MIWTVGYGMKYIYQAGKSPAYIATLQYSLMLYHFKTDTCSTFDYLSVQSTDFGYFYLVESSQQLANVSLCYCVTVLPLY